MKKILDTTKKEFYFFENTKLLTLDDLLDILKKTKEKYNKAVKYAEKNNLSHTFIPNEKQYIALQYLDLKNFDKSRVALGGSVASSKTALGAYWIISNALQYKGTAYGVGRLSLSVMDRTTIPSFMEMLDILKVPKKMYKYNSQKHEMKFYNGSVIYFVELKYRPDDPDYSRVRGLQLTAAFIDEANEINEDGISYLAARTGRKKNDEYNLKGKTLFTFNPSKGFVKREFYDPWKKDMERNDTIFIPSMAINNPFVAESYIEELWKLPFNIKQTMLLVNFDYSDEENAIVTYQDIQNSFTNVVSDVSQRYMSVDIAGTKGNDNTVITLWRGWELFHLEAHQNMTTDAIIEKIRTLAAEYDIPFQNIVVDAIGVGEGVAYSNRLPGIFPFKSSNSPMLETDTIATRNKYDEVELQYHKVAPKYSNLRSQSAWVLARQMKKGEFRISVPLSQRIKVDGEEKNIQEVFEEELSLLRDKNFGKDEMKRQLIPKNEMKEFIGRSPDVLDTCIMRSVFELTKEYEDVRTKTTVPFKERKFYKAKKKKKILV